VRAFWFIPFRHVAADDLERWFESMAERGWAPTRLGQWSSLRMRLSRGEPKTSRYVVDQQTRPRPEYFSTYRDAGWDLVGQMASMYVWRKEYRGSRPEAFTDRYSKYQRNRRFALSAATAAAVIFAGAIVLAGAAVFAQTNSGTRLQLWIASGLFVVITMAITLAAAVIWRGRQR
jgi:hypothetical protein